MADGGRQERAMEAALDAPPYVECPPPYVECGQPTEAPAAEGGSLPGGYIAEIERLQKVVYSKDASHAKDIQILEEMVQTQMMRSAELEASLESLRREETARPQERTGGSATATPRPYEVKEGPSQPPRGNTAGTGDSPELRGQARSPSKLGAGGGGSGTGEARSGEAGGDGGAEEEEELAEMQARQNAELVRLIAEMRQREEALRQLQARTDLSHVAEMAELQEQLAALTVRCAELEAALATRQRGEAERQAEVTALQAMMGKVAQTEDWSAQTIQHLEESVAVRNALMHNQDRRIELREQEHRLQLLKLQAAVEKVSAQAEGSGLEVSVACLKELVSAMKRSERDYHFQRAAVEAAASAARPLGDEDHLLRVELEASNAVLEAAGRKMRDKASELWQLEVEAVAAAGGMAAPSVTASPRESSRLQSPAPPPPPAPPARGGVFRSRSQESLPYSPRPSPVETEPPKMRNWRSSAPASVGAAGAGAPASSDSGTESPTQGKQRRLVAVVGTGQASEQQLPLWAEERPTRSTNQSTDRAPSLSFHPGSVTIPIRMTTHPDDGGNHSVSVRQSAPTAERRSISPQPLPSARRAASPEARARSPLRAADGKATSLQIPVGGGRSRAVGDALRSLGAGTSSVSGFVFRSATSFDGPKVGRNTQGAAAAAVPTGICASGGQSPAAPAAKRDLVWSGQASTPLLTRRAAAMQSPANAPRGARPASPLAAMRTAPAVPAAAPTVPTPAPAVSTGGGSLIMSFKREQTDPHDSGQQGLQSPAVVSRNPAQQLGVPTAPRPPVVLVQPAPLAVGSGVLPAPTKTVVQPSPKVTARGKPMASSHSSIVPPPAGKTAQSSIPGTPVGSALVPSNRPAAPKAGSTSPAWGPGRFARMHI